MLNNILKIESLLYKDSKYYLYTMFFYHILVIVYMLIGIPDFKAKIFFTLSLDSINFSVFHGNASILSNIIFGLMIMFIDMIFLLICMYEFKELKLTYTKVFILEIIIFSISLSNPTLRMIMLFLSLNAFPITFFYKLAKLSFLKHIILTGSYIITIKLLIYPFYKLIEAYITLTG